MTKIIWNEKHFINILKNKTKQIWICRDVFLLVKPSSGCLWLSDTDHLEFIYSGEKLIYRNKSLIFSNISKNAKLTPLMNRNGVVFLVKGCWWCRLPQPPTTPGEETIRKIRLITIADPENTAQIAFKTSHWLLPMIES